MKIEHEIDFVVTWVDGNDPVWLEEKRRYINEGSIKATAAQRFRDWDNMKYWFRAVEKYAPWVHKVYFVTYGHLPKFLNTDCPKLQIVKHRDFIPDKYLPTYSANPIELNFHRIPELAEHFVLFNDDMFLNAQVKPTDFFRHGMPCEEAVEGLIVPWNNDMYFHMLLNDIDCINKHFSKRTVQRKNFTKWFNPCYGSGLLQNILLQPWRKFNGLKNAHLPVALCKSTYEKIWEAEPQRMDATCKNRFRTAGDLTQYLIRYWQLAEGNFIPRKSIGQYLEIRSDKYDDVLDAITAPRHRFKTICINDTDDQFDFDCCASRVKEAFQKVLPEKSLFEK